MGWGRGFSVRRADSQPPCMCPATKVLLPDCLGQMSVFPGASMGCPLGQWLSADTEPPDGRPTNPSPCYTLPVTAKTWPRKKSSWYTVWLRTNEPSVSSIPCTAKEPSPHCLEYSLCKRHANLRTLSRPQSPRVVPTVWRGISATTNPSKHMTTLRLRAT